MIPETIIAEMFHLQMSRAELHRRTGIRYATLINFLNGKTGITTGNLEKICRVLDLRLTNVNDNVDIYQRKLRTINRKSI